MKSNQTLTWIVIIVLAVLLLPKLLHVAFGLLLFSAIVVGWLLKLAVLVAVIALIIGVARSFSR